MAVEIAIKENNEQSLPAGWKWVRLNDICTLCNETINPQDNPQEIFAHYSIPAFDDGCRPVFEAGSQILSNKIFFPSGAVLFSKLNPRISRVWWVVDEHQSKRICSTEFLPIIPNPSCINPLFLQYVLREPTILARLRKQVSSATKSRERLKPDLVMNAIIPLPPLPEQKRIVAILNEQMAVVEKARAACEAQLEAAKALPAAYLRSVFESEEAKRWERKKLGDIALVSGGIQKSPDRAPSAFHKPYLTVRNVQRGYLVLDNVEQFEITPDELDRLRLCIGDILIVEGNGSPEQIGRNAVFKGEIEDCIHQNHLIRVRLNSSECNFDFVAAYLNSDAGKRQMREKAESTTGLHTLSVSKVQSLEVLVPPLDTQTAIMQDMETKMSMSGTLQHLLDDHHDYTCKLPSAILRKAFRGEI